ncbi:heptatricopeptide repeat and RAP domain-containing protein [Plasmodium brasilianum]|uniref:Heptatricopeptide repeat and RAP domain-containing protein n=1 Tax=Plasmodium brasilianum TaxID=5824 RepID=A0ACB9YEP2_PLABR|nr:heptatricopeptide repeat and RAP domain-containing protein [Plasmodium brasilianum]
MLKHDPVHLEKAIFMCKLLTQKKKKKKGKSKEVKKRRSKEVKKRRSKEVKKRRNKEVKKRRSKEVKKRRSKEVKKRRNKEVKKRRSKEVKKRRSKEVKKRRSKEVKKQRSKEVKKRRSKEVKKQRSKEGKKQNKKGLSNKQEVRTNIYGENKKIRLNETEARFRERGNSILSNDLHSQYGALGKMRIIKTAVDKCHFLPMLAKRRISCLPILGTINRACTKIKGVNSNSSRLNELVLYRNVTTNVLEKKRENNVEEYMTNDEIINFFEENKNMNIDKLYNLIKTLSRKKIEERKKIVENEKFLNFIEEIENRISIMNTRYLCNFALRLASISINNDEIKKVLTKISEHALKKINMNPRDLVGIGYSLGLCNNMNEYFFEHLKKETISNIDAYTPTLLTQLLECMRLSQNLDVELTNLIVEKMCEEIDRFTTRDVTLALKTLSMAGIPRGFLIRRLCNLVFDNISHFHHTALINIIYNLTKLKFTTNNHIDVIYKNVEEHLENCNTTTLCELLYTFYMNEINEENRINKILENINYEHFNTTKTAVIIDFIHACTYYTKYVDKEKFENLISLLFSRNVPKSLTLIAKIREPIYFLSADSTFKFDLNNISPSWLNAMNDFLRIDHEKLQALKTFHEVQNVLNIIAPNFKLNFVPLQITHSYSVDFIENEKKIVIDLDTIVRHTSFQIKHKYFENLGYKTAKIHFWKWRKCRSEKEQQNYLCDILYSVTDQKKNLEEINQHEGEKKMDITQHDS